MATPCHKPVLLYIKELLQNNFVIRQRISKTKNGVEHEKPQEAKI
jgi:hypothetical protein